MKGFPTLTFNKYIFILQQPPEYRAAVLFLYHENMDHLFNYAAEPDRFNGFHRQ